jgi:hypothetical protein
MQFEFSRQFPNIYIHGLVHFPVDLYLPFCTLFCGDQPKRQIHSPLAAAAKVSTFKNLDLYNSQEN